MVFMVSGQLFPKKIAPTPSPPAGLILNIGRMGAFLGGTLSEKMAFCFLAPSKQMSILTISNENIFLKTHGTRLGAIVGQRSRIGPARLKLRLG